MKCNEKKARNLARGKHLWFGYNIIVEWVYFIINKNVAKMETGNHLSKKKCKVRLICTNFFMYKLVWWQIVLLPRQSTI
jgi:hypothetical protein